MGCIDCCLKCGYLMFLCCFCETLYQDVDNDCHVFTFYLWLVCNIFASGSQEEPFDGQQARNPSLLYTFTSAQPLKGLAVGISHNAFSHRETSSQHEQGRNVARVWERLSGWREGVTDQRAWSGEGRK